VLENETLVDDDSVKDDELLADTLTDALADRDMVDDGVIVVDCEPEAEDDEERESDPLVDTLPDSEVDSDVDGVEDRDSVTV
jgi:hypothetical protein